MLEIVVPGTEYWDESKQEFVNINTQKLRLEHSLVSLSKWEMKWNKPFLNSKDKTHEEIIDYVRCMTLTQNVNPNIYYAITSENIERINAYIDAPMTATTFSEKNLGRSREIITSELIYYWMIAQNIPFECQKWHLNRLLTLIRVCNIKNAPPKKMGRRATMSRNAALNAARRKQFNTSG